MTTTTTEAVYTYEEVARHNSADDIWMILHGGVYDVSKFLTVHPGGEEVLLNLAGQDGTTCFEEMGHTTDAIELRKNYKVGVVSNDGSSGATASVSKDKPLSDIWVYEDAKPKDNTLIKTLVASLVIIYAALFYYLTS